MTGNVTAVNYARLAIPVGCIASLLSMTAPTLAAPRSFLQSVGNGQEVPSALITDHLAGHYGDNLRNVSATLRRAASGELGGSLNISLETSPLLDEAKLPSEDADPIARAHAMARVFLERHGETLLEIEDLSELRELRTIDLSSMVGKSNANGRSTVIVFQRYIHDIQVSGFRLSFIFRDNMEDVVSATLVPVPRALADVRGRKLLSEAEVTRIAFGIPQWQETEEPYRSDRTIEIKKMLTPECLAFVARTRAWEVWINATTGQVLNAYPLIIRD